MSATKTQNIQEIKNLLKRRKEDCAIHYRKDNVTTTNVLFDYEEGKDGNIYVWYKLSRSLNKKKRVIGISYGNDTSKLFPKEDEAYLVVLD